MTFLKYFLHVSSCLSFSPHLTHVYCIIINVKVTSTYICNKFLDKASSCLYDVVMYS